MSDFKRKLNYLIQEQVPDYIVSNYPKFVTFLEKYYEFLDSDEQANNLLLNSAVWSDIDNTLDDFIPYFKKQHALDIPESALLNSRRIIKYIHEYYEAKGSENAAELFFRFMYNDTATVVYPGDYILRASDGKWSRKKIIKIDTEAFQSQDIFELISKTIQFKYLEFISGEGSVLRSITTSCFNVIRQVEPFIYQLEVDINPNYVFPSVITPLTNTDLFGNGNLVTIESLGNYDTHVYLTYNNNIYGSISKQIVGIQSIDVPGSNFRIDDSYAISETGIEQVYFAETYTADAQPYVFETFNNNAVIRVKNITARNIGSGIEEIQLVNTGQKFVAREENAFAEIAYFAADYTVDPEDYAADALAIEPVETFEITVTPRAPRNIAGTPATITFNTGLIYQTVGNFKDSSGFLSDINHLQDNDYYQPYSYVIRSQQPLSTWKDTYIKSNHPAGFKVFSELQFVDTITDTVTVVDNFSIIIFKLEEVFFITETINKNISTIIDSAYFAEDYVDPTYSVANNENSFTLTDSLNTETTSVIGDSFTVTDSVQLI
jgi:hypothetical protein